MLTKDNVTIGIELRFWPDWPGQRCGAKTRRGAACLRPANKKNGRCQLHGGASTGAKTEEGLARIARGCPAKTALGILWFAPTGA